MKKIFKFPLEAHHKQEIDMPVGAQILALQVKDDTPCLWALVDPNRPKEKRTFLMVGTGHSAASVAGPDCTYVGTFQMRDAPEDDWTVWHLFEKRRYI